MMLKNRNSAFALLAFLCGIQQSFQCSPGPDYKPPTIAELTSKAPIVVRGYIVNKGSDINQYKACMYVSRVYKGRVRDSYICASNFGSTAACLADPQYGTEYLFFLNKKGKSYVARYDSIHSAAQVFTNNSEAGVRNGKCCELNLKKSK